MNREQVEVHNAWYNWNGCLGSPQQPTAGWISGLWPPSEFQTNLRHRAHARSMGLPCSNKFTSGPQFVAEFEIHPHIPYLQNHANEVLQHYCPRFWLSVAPTWLSWCGAYVVIQSEKIIKPTGPTCQFHTKNNKIVGAHVSPTCHPHYSTLLSILSLSQAKRDGAAAGRR